MTSVTSETWFDRPMTWWVQQSVRSLLQGIRDRAHLSVLVLVVAGAFLLRIYWLFTHTALICNEGGAYASIAESLLAGRGYVGIYGGPELYFPPLYPLLIALFSLLTRNSELAGRLVSLLAGTCLVLPCAGIAARIYGRKVAYLCALLVACHPLLIALSASVYSEALFATLLMTAVYWTMRSLEQDKSKTHYMLAGIFWGLAYLARPEAIAYAAVAACALFVVNFASRKELKKACLTTAWLILPFLFIAAPYAAYLSGAIGGLHVEAKSNLNYTIGQRLNSGMNPNQANWGISRDLREEGPLLNINLYVSRSPYPKTLGILSAYVVSAAKRNSKELYRGILPSSFLGSPFLLVLTLFGLFRKPWTRQRSLQEGLLLLLISLAFFILLAAHEIQSRYVFPLLPFFLVWAANGAHELGDWASSTAAYFWPDDFRNAQRVDWTVQYGMIALVLFTAMVGFSHDPEPFADDTQEYQAEKQVGLWLRKVAPKARIASSGTAIPYYAGAVWIPLPYADSSLALKYLVLKDPNFVVLPVRRGQNLPYMEDWISHGIPDEKAKMIFETHNPVGERIFVYSWSRTEAAGPH